MRKVRVDLNDGGRIDVSREDNLIIIESPASWRLPLSLEEAWELAEALDAVATGAPDGNEPGPMPQSDDS